MANSVVTYSVQDDGSAKPLARYSAVGGIVRVQAIQGDQDQAIDLTDQPMFPEGGGEPVYASDDPEEWVALLPLNRDGTYFFAKAE